MGVGVGVGEGEAVQETTTIPVAGRTPEGKR